MIARASPIPALFPLRIPFRNKRLSPPFSSAQRQYALCPLLLVSATRLPNKNRPQSKNRLSFPAFAQLSNKRLSLARAAPSLLVASQLSLLTFPAFAQLSNKRPSPPSGTTPSTSPLPFQDRGGRAGGVVAATSRDITTQHI